MTHPANRQLVLITYLLNHLCNFGNLINTHNLIRATGFLVQRHFSNNYRLNYWLCSILHSKTSQVPCIAEGFRFFLYVVMPSQVARCHLCFWLVDPVHLFDGCHWSIGWSQTGSTWGAGAIDINGRFGHPVQDACGGTVVNSVLARAVSRHRNSQCTQKNSHPRHYEIVSSLGHSLYSRCLKESGNTYLYCMMNWQTLTFRSCLIRKTLTCLTDDSVWLWNIKCLNKEYSKINYDNSITLKMDCNYNSSPM